MDHYHYETQVCYDFLLDGCRIMSTWTIVIQCSSALEIVPQEKCRLETQPGVKSSSGAPGVNGLSTQVEFQGLMD